MRKPPTPGCPLWVMSGHVGLHESESALPLKADILQDGGNSQLCANRGHSGGLRLVLTDERAHLL